MRPVSPALVALALLLPAFAGCLLPEPGAEPLRPGDLRLTPAVLTGGEFRPVTFTAAHPLAVLVPYLLRDPTTGLVQNGTVIELGAGESRELELLAPPRAGNVTFLLAPPGRAAWPLRDANESWDSWLARGGPALPARAYVAAVAPANGSSLATLVPINATAGSVVAARFPVQRPAGAGLTDAQGARHATGLVAGRAAYDWIARLTDETPSATSPDGAVGYLDRWIGESNPSYEDAIEFLASELASYGLEVEKHRAQTVDHPEAVNVCGYRTGTVEPDEWLVIGGHFDIAPIVVPSVGGDGYGTRTGAYDNTAGSAVILTLAAALARFETRRTLVFCFWSGEEQGKRGSDAWTRDLPPDITVVNYLNLDMAGVNWPGGGTPADRDGPDGGGSYPASQEQWPLRLYLGPDSDSEVINQPALAWLAMWIGGDAMGVEAELEMLTGDLKAAWALNQSGVIINEATTARSDHASFQDNLDVATLGFGGLVDGYDCYHKLCDTLDEMDYWMETEAATGTQNLVDSLDLVVWWAFQLFLHLDERPALNAL